MRHNCITHKRFSHLAIIGMRKGENEYTYPPYERTQAEELLQALRGIAPYVIIDCGSSIANDILSAIALLKESRWDAEKQYRVASNVYPNEASSHMEQVLGSVSFQIPHSGEVAAQVLEGNLLKELGLKDSRAFRKSLESITREVFGC